MLQANAKAAFWSGFYEEPRWHFSYPTADNFAGANVLQTNTATGASVTGIAQDRCLVRGPIAPTTVN